MNESSRSTGMKIYDLLNICCDVKYLEGGQITKRSFLFLICALLLIVFAFALFWLLVDNDSI